LSIQLGAIKLEVLETSVEISGIGYTHKVHGLPDHDYWVFARPKFEDGNILHIIVYNPSTHRSNKVLVTSQ